ncbi:hypothetical protein BpHYR1_052867 [Brachionus plicatilis]|uniref:Uncharacterized protein n=1 Tax=Brachionus plicatilis TaxID=10195 RepID=A0A3M7RJE7_BRAPC|nr:hypothetical protein BpHYR1_052867 [Brachionus plicatilis]
MDSMENFKEAIENTIHFWAANKRNLKKNGSTFTRKFRNRIFDKFEDQNLFRASSQIEIIWKLLIFFSLLKLARTIYFVVNKLNWLRKILTGSNVIKQSTN